MKLSGPGDSDIQGRGEVEDVPSKQAADPACFRDRFNHDAITFRSRGRGSAG